MKKQQMEKYLQALDKLWSTGGWVAMCIIADAASKKPIVASKELKVRYFGEARKSATPSQNSYNQKRVKALELGIIVGVEGIVGAYSITDFGKAVLAYAKEKGIDASELKSKAQRDFEARS